MCGTIVFAVSQIGGAHRAKGWSNGFEDGHPLAQGHGPGLQIALEPIATVPGIRDALLNACRPIVTGNLCFEGRASVRRRLLLPRSERVEHADAVGGEQVLLVNNVIGGRRGTGLGDHPDEKQNCPPRSSMPHSRPLLRPRHARHCNGSMLSAVGDRARPESRRAESTDTSATHFGDVARSLASTPRSSTPHRGAARRRNEEELQ